ncbi:MAG: hypothetical protein H6579_10025 [Chitinophagales bacterium]|nr:hypothetical protein [Bacteroidota bacterium]MCB9257456.1 hypothetical protein [Chitinophagales bacterium]
MRFPKILILSLLFACIGITTEVIFTSISAVVRTFFDDSAIDWALGGKTYLWMFFIYASIPFIMRAFEPLVHKYNTFVRAIIGVAIIYLVEFTTGFLLEITTGACPWKYTEGMHIMGYIRLDYFPAWLVFSLIVISVYQMLDKRLN